jgi:hypothetical protein
MRWRTMLENPTVIAALVAGITTLGVATAGVVQASVTAYFQRHSEKDRLASETRRVVLLETNKRNTTVEESIKFFIDSGLIEDEDCRLRKAILQSQDCVPVSKR